jgi:hypothetical protein
VTYWADNDEEESLGRELFDRFIPGKTYNFYNLELKKPDKRYILDNRVAYDGQWMPSRTFAQPSSNSVDMAIFNVPPVDELLPSNPNRDNTVNQLISIYI